MEIVITLFAIIMSVIMAGGAIFTLIYALVKEVEKEEIIEIDGHKCKVVDSFNSNCEGCMFADKPIDYCANVVSCISKYRQNIIFIEVEE